MEAWATALISIAGSAAVSGIVGYLIKRSLDKLFKRKDEEETRRKAEEAEYKKLKEQRLREERRQDVQLAIEAGIKPLNDKIDSLDCKLTKVEGASLSTLRDAITSCYYKCSEKGYRNDYDYQNVHHMYDNYRELNGNSYIADIVSRFDALPPKEDTVPTKVVERKPRNRKKVLVENK